MIDHDAPGLRLRTDEGLDKQEDPVRAKSPWRLHKLHLKLTSDNQKLDQDPKMATSAVSASSELLASSEGSIAPTSSSRKSNASSSSTSSGGEGPSSCEEYPWHNVFPMMFPYHASTGGSVRLGPFTTSSSSDDNTSAKKSISMDGSFHQHDDHHASHQRQQDEIVPWAVRESCWEQQQQKQQDHQHMIEDRDDDKTNLWQEKEEMVAREMGMCVRCCVTRTHDIKIVHHNDQITFERYYPITNLEAYQGHCVRCFPSKVRILKEYASLIRNDDNDNNHAVVTNPRDDDDEKDTCCRKEAAFSTFWLAKRKVKTHSPLLLTTAGSTADTTKEKDDTARKIKSTTNTHDDDNNINHHRRSSSRSCRCIHCGNVRTHKVFLGQRIPLTTADVFQGRCIQCTMEIPLGVLQKWQHKQHNGNIPHLGVKEEEAKTKYTGSASRMIKAGTATHIGGSGSGEGIQPAFPQTRRISENDLIVAIIQRQAKFVSSFRGDAADGDDDLFPAQVHLSCGASSSSSMEERRFSGGMMLSQPGISLLQQQLPVAVAVQDEDTFIYPVAVEEVFDKIRRGYCQTCGIVKTHRRRFFFSRLFRAPLTNQHVYEGHCLQCQPEMRQLLA